MNQMLQAVVFSATCPLNTIIIYGIYGIHGFYTSCAAQSSALFLQVVTGPCVLLQLLHAKGLVLCCANSTVLFQTKPDSWAFYLRS